MSTIKEITKEFLAAKEQYEAEKKKISVRGKELIQDVLKSVFDEDPDLASVGWDQYTPYFNDGDPCVFSVNDVGCAWFKDNVTPEERENMLLPDRYWDDEEGFIVEESVGWRDFTLIGSDPQNPDWGLPEKCRKSWNTLAEFNKFLQANQDLAQDIFGDHVQIRATREGIEVEECSHD